MDDEALLGQLTAWDIGAVSSLADIPQRGKASRTWEVQTASGDRYVAKLIFDGRRFAEPGLRVAAAVDARGITTGRPVLTRGGQLSLEIDGWTLALLRYVSGSPLDVGIAGVPRLLGKLLGRVHTALQASTSRGWVPGDLLTWLARASANLRATSALAAISELERAGPLRQGVVYGDPAPEVLRDERSQAVALIDWGTPSWGPLAHDVACWLRFLSSWGRGGEADRSAFLGAYGDHMPLDGRELDAIDTFLALHRALGLRPR